MKLVVNEPQVVENYPYGRLKTQATFSIEFKKGKGFRSVFQTVNPKTGRINNPKLGTYYPLMVMEVSEDGFVQNRANYFYGSDSSFKEAMEFMAENCPLFTDEQIEYIAKEALMCLKSSMIGSVQYGGCNFDDIKGYYEQPIKILTEIVKTKNNLFGKIIFDYKAVEAHKPANFNPFKVTALQTVG